ncbi:hypothetical protein HK096_011180, partial [Nowakowskiella sp. JEL0078]
MSVKVAVKYPVSNDADSIKSPQSKVAEKRPPGFLKSNDLALHSSPQHELEANKQGISVDSIQDLIENTFSCSEEFSNQKTIPFNIYFDKNEFRRRKLLKAPYLMHASEGIQVRESNDLKFFEGVEMIPGDHLLFNLEINISHINHIKDVLVCEFEDFVIC